MRREYSGMICVHLPADFVVRGILSQGNVPLAKWEGGVFVV